MSLTKFKTASLKDKHEALELGLVDKEDKTETESVKEKVEKKNKSKK